MEIRNKKLSEEEFRSERQDVLSQWPTGQEVKLEESIEFHKSLPPEKNYARKLKWAKENGKTLIRTDSGVPSLDEHVEYLKFLQDKGGSELLGTMVDSFTRTHRFNEAEKELKESLKTGKWRLNGLPIVNYGVSKLRRIIETVDLPIAIRGIGLDWRLIMEIGLASGHSDNSSSPTMAFWHYSTNTPLAISIRNHQYNYRLIGCYEEAGVPISTSIGGGFTILCPYSVIKAAAIIDILIAAEQGVKNIHITIQHQGHLAQDVAVTIALPKLAQEYLDRYGYKDMVITTDGNSWSGQFPTDAAEAYAVLCLSVVANVIASAQIAHVKTIDEAIAIPTKESNAASLRAGKKVINILKDQKIQLDNRAIASEIEIMTMETRAIVEKVIELGDGDVAVGAVKAIESGILDNPFAATKYVAGKVLGVRDNEGAVRYLDCGNLPFSKEIVDFNKKKIAEREKAQGRKVDYESVINDLFSISQGSLVNRGRLSD
jgi:methylaspartate mutase epsilon subunit